MPELRKIHHHFVIEPLVGVGLVRFGMTKDEVSHAFTYVYRSSFPASDSKFRSDYIEVVGLIVHYDDEGRVNSIVVSQPKSDLVSLELLGRDVTSITMREAVELLSPLATTCQEYLGYDFPELGLRLHNSRYISDDDPVGSFSVGPASPLDPYRPG
jgi:hypothetical protein